MSFWKKTRPIVGLAPMDGITDAPMRQITARYGQPEVIFTEFVNVEYAAAQPNKLFNRFWYSSDQRPIVVQLSGVNPDLFYQFALIAAELGFDGIDINMGCPAKSVTARGGGAKLIGNKKLVEKLILSVNKGLDDWQKGKGLDSLDKNLFLALEKTRQKNRQWGGVNKAKKSPPALSIKTRLGIDRPLVEDWLNFLLSLPIETLIVHGRLVSQGHSGLVDWVSLSRAADFAGRENKAFIGNGGIGSFREGEEVCQKYNLDGVLIGRGALGNPWVFTNQKVAKEEKLLVMMEHARCFVDLFGEDNFVVLRKHLAWYAAGFPGAKKLRVELVRTSCLSEVEKIVNHFYLIFN
ncbi:MAG: Dihydrouridine synthase DuS [Microgenomates bacterium 39_6]|nr:MAG: Dihydrouridine synthase DuS [Microgenomates bacterium 39_6]